MKKNGWSQFWAISFLAVFMWFSGGQEWTWADALPNDVLENHYLFDHTFSPHRSSKKPVDSPYLTDGKVTAETLELFRLLERTFAVNSIRELKNHFDLVRRDLLSRFPPSAAETLFDHYQRYLLCQIVIVNDDRFETKSLDPKDLLVQLHRIHNFRREKLGSLTADTLFGQEVKEREYLLRRWIIIGMPTLSGEEKERRLKKLKKDMWGDETPSVGEDQDPYNRYEQKLQIYAKDLSEMDEVRRRQKIDEFRKEFFSPEQMERLRKAESETIAEEETLKRYRAEEKKILETPGMPPKQRSQAIRTLQDKFFGSEADAFRRREAIAERPPSTD